jgi:uncharacterized protein (TIGR00369 family)
MSNQEDLEALLQRHGPQPPIADLLTTRITALDTRAGTITVAFEGQPGWINPHGGIQGGMVAALLDETMGALLTFVLFPSRRGLTLELKVNMLRLAKPGPLVAEGRVVQRSKNIAFLEAELRDHRQRLIATATSTASIQESPTVAAGSPLDASAAVPA